MGDGPEECCSEKEARYSDLSTSAPSSNSGTCPGARADPDEEEKLLAGLLSDHTLILLDWDDTIFPSTWAVANGLRMQNGLMTELPPDIRATLESCAASAHEALLAALAVGTVVVVTNAQKGWVELSAKHFMPTVAELMARHGVRVVSARSEYESKAASGAPVDPIVWKEQAFHNELQNFAAERGLLNAVSIGDSTCERDALLSKASACRHARIKSIKLPDKPSAAELATTLKLLAQALQVCCTHDGHLDLCLVPRSTTA